jgi:hypothetical protein
MMTTKEKFNEAIRQAQFDLAQMRAKRRVLDDIIKIQEYEIQELTEIKNSIKEESPEELTQQNLKGLKQ